MKAFLSYWFWPNPGNLHYGDTIALAGMGIGAGFLLVSLVLYIWRRQLKNPVTRKLSRSWTMAALWFGVIPVVLVVSRVEPVLFLAMRALWVVWALVVGAYAVVQVLQFRLRHYTVVKKEHTFDERDKYLPARKRKN